MEDDVKFQRMTFSDTRVDFFQAICIVVSLLSTLLPALPDAIG